MLTLHFTKWKFCFCIICQCLCLYRLWRCLEVLAYW